MGLEENRSEDKHNAQVTDPYEEAHNRAVADMESTLVHWVVPWPPDRHMENCHGMVYDVACVGVGDLVRNTQMPLPRATVGKVRNHTGRSDFLTAPFVDPVAYSMLGMGYSLD